jgi:ABC-type Mn2+/Zn2+ transport system permease subunit
VAWLWEPLQFEFMRNAATVGVLMAILAAVVGTYVVVQQLSIIGTVIAHAVLPGLSVATFLGVSLTAGALVTGILSAFAVAVIRDRSSIKTDAAMAFTLASFTALGIIAISALGTDRVDLDNILFGNILGVTAGDVKQTAAVTAAVLACAYLFRNELLFYSFDPLGARASGLPVRWLYFGFIIAVALAVITTMQIAGVLLVTSLLIGPPITAYLLVRELYRMMLLAAAIGVTTSTSGLYLSYYFDLPSGAAIATVTFAAFGVAFLLATERQRAIAPRPGRSSNYPD